MFRKLTIFVLFSCLIVSCAMNQLTMDKIQNIEKNYSPEQLNEVLSPKNPEFEFTISAGDKEYFIQMYDMVVRSEIHGQNHINNDTAIVNFQFGGFTPPPPPTFDPLMMPTTHTVTYTEPYAFIFENSLLIYWGFFEELNKSDDEQIIELSPKIQTEYERLQKEKKINQ